MKTINLFLLLLSIILLSCAKSEDSTTTFTKEKLTGYIQKGPFVNGSSLTVYELDGKYAQTGKSFSTQIADNTGTFELSGINITSNYVKIKADGYYYNEVSDAVSLAPITLYAFTDLAMANTVNVNLLTTLELSRMQYLMGTGLNFGDAKKQAQSDVLKIFSITKPGIAQSELLNISQNGDDNAILLATSVILQGFRTEADLSQLLGDIATDIRTDGILNSASTGSMLINDIKLIDLAKIRTNLAAKYQALGINATIPDFEKYVKIFEDSTSYKFDKFIVYPYMVNSRQNLLYDSSFAVTGTIKYSLAAYLPMGSYLKVVVTPSPGYNWNVGNLGFFPMENAGWTYENPWANSMLFYAQGNNQTVDIPMMFGPPTSSDFKMYENYAEVPTRVKTIKN